MMEGNDPGEERRVHVLENPAAASPARLTDLVRRLTPVLHDVAYRVLGDHGGAEEVVQDSFTKLADAEVIDRPDGEVVAWLRRVTLNAAFNRARGQRRARDRADRAARLEPAEPGVEHATPLAAVLAAEERAAVRRALAELPPTQRTVLLLRSAGCSYAEIAAAAEIAVGSVGVLLARGERAFRRAYGGPNDPDTHAAEDAR